MLGLSGWGYLSRKSTSRPQIAQWVWVAYIFFFAASNAPRWAPSRSGRNSFGTKYPPLSKNGRRGQKEPQDACLFAPRKKQPRRPEQAPTPNPSVAAVALSPPEKHPPG